MRTAVRTTYLELLHPGALRPAPRPAECELVRAEVPSPELNRFFYTAVGSEWYWHDRLRWSWAEWQALLSREGYQTWFALCRGTPAGYFELDLTRPPDAEVAYFGLLPSFTGRGIGGWLLSQAADQGFAAGAGRVWLHTCSLDHPAALANYLARGFTVYREDQREIELPDLLREPWPGARRPGRVAEEVG